MDSEQVLETFLSRVKHLGSPAYGREYLLSALKPALEFEASIRRYFAAGGSGGPRLINPYVGLFDPFSIPDDVRCIQARISGLPGPFSFPSNPRDLFGAILRDTEKDYYSYFSPTHGALCSFSRHYMFPLGRNLLRKTGDPCMVKDLDAFQKNLRIFSHGALSEITNWNNIVITGGCVTASLLGLGAADGDARRGWDVNDHFQSELYRSSDIDMFFYGLTPEEANVKLKEIYSAIEESDLWTLTVVRKADRISIHSLYPRRPLQIRLNIFASPAEILANCDIDSACCAYDGTKVWMNPRALIAFICQSNQIDLERCSPSYEIRLANYAKRGFEIHVPFLDRERVNYEQVYNRHLQDLPLGLARLLTLELLLFMPDHLERLCDYPMRRVGPSSLPSSVGFASIDKRITNNPEALWAHVPYGPVWDNCTLSALTVEINAEMNPVGRHSVDTRRLHRHPIYSSDLLAECLEDICTDCPAPQTIDEEETVRLEHGLYCRGPLKFYTREQHILENYVSGQGVDNETDRISAWTREAYHEELTHPHSNIITVPRDLWLKKMVHINWDLFSGGKNYHEVEGAGQTAKSRFQIELAITHFWDDFDDFENLTGQ